MDPMVLTASLGGLVARSTASGWLLCVIGLFGVWRLYIIARPKMREIEQDGEEKLRAEMWKDIAALKQSRTELGGRVTRAEAKIAAQGVELGQQRFIINLVITELENVSPGNAIARQARILMDQVQPAAFARSAMKLDDELIDKLERETGT